jgi:hypothetical protein
MVARPETRAKFIENLVALINANDFDGVDYNWYRAHPIAPHVQTQA